MKDRMTNSQHLSCTLALSAGTGLLLAFLLATFFATAGTAQASQPPDVPAPLMVDAQSYASEHGTTVAESARRLGVRRGQQGQDRLVRQGNR